MSKIINLRNLVLITSMLSFICTQNIKAQVAFKISERDLIPEGITYSSSTNSFYLSSLAKNKIIQFNVETSKHDDFISSEILGLKVLGLMVDDHRKHLWACANGLKGDQNFSTVARFDLLTGKLIKAYEEKDNLRFTVNDLTLDANGNAYFTNMAKHAVYRINKKTDKVEEFISGSQIETPNGITISTDGKYLYVASEKKGIRVVDIEKQTVINDPIKLSAGIDGLKYYNNSLIGVQNEVRYKRDVKIIRFYLDAQGTASKKMEIIDQDNQCFEIPTTCVIVENNLYVLANSQMGKLSRIEAINKDELNDTIILKYAL